MGTDEGIRPGHRAFDVLHLIEPERGSRGSRGLKIVKRLGVWC